MIKVDIQLKHKLKGHRGAIYKIIEGPQAGSWISAGGDGWITIWQPEQNEDGRLVARDEDNIFCIHPHSSGKILAGTLQGNLLLIGDSQENTRKIVHHRRGLYDIANSPFGLITAGADGNLTWWDESSLRPIETIRLSEKALRKIALHPNKHWAAVGSSDGHIYLIDLEKRCILHSYAAHQGAVFSIVYSLNGEMLYSGGLDAMLKAWETDHLECLQALPAHWFTVNDLALHPSGNLLASASRDKTIKIWSANDLELLKVIDYAKFKAHQHSVNSISWSTDGQLLSSGSDDRSVCVFQVGIVE